VKRLVRPMLGFKSFWSARCTIAGIQVMRATRKVQFVSNRTKSQTPAAQFDALAAEVTRSENSIRLYLYRKIATIPASYPWTTTWPCSSTPWSWNICFATSIPSGVQFITDPPSLCC